ncbi:MAG TPA: 3-hydroxybutyrate dehydrogenase [Steroidobacteraceae bacterium]|nr:3-hydroxybutyrate dehydrogenase [Steroidobacteraceae bacterium]
MSRQTRSALVTGAASGIGLGIATHLAERGLAVHLTDLDGAGAKQAAHALRQRGLEATAGELDVRSATEIDAAVAALEPSGPDLLVNNAGLQHVAPLEEFPRERWELLVAVMLTGSAMLTRALLPGMRRRGFGRIVNIGSIHSLVGSPYKSAYVAAKHGLIGFAKTVALETADTDITINTICPSYVLTPLVQAQIAGQARAHGIPEQQVIDEVMLQPMPKHAFVTVEELGGIVEFLASPAARNITGQWIAVDGGWTAR